MLVVSGKALGQRKPLFADFSIAPPPEWVEGGGLTLRGLLEHIVRHEVAAFRQRQRDRQVVRILTSREIEGAAERGKIEMGGSGVPVQEVDEQAAVSAVLEAFEDGLYLVVIDGQQQHSLDQQVFLTPESRLAFIRLAMLAGG